MLTVSMEISIVDICAFVISAAGGCFALLQWRKAQKLRRAEHVKDLLLRFRDDTEIADAFYRIDYGEEWYTKEFIEEHKDEKRFDRLFAYADYACYLLKQHVIGAKEFQPFEYRICRLANNRDVQSYFFNLYHFSKRNNVPMSFQYLLNYMRKEGLLFNDFDNSESSNFKVWLNI